MKYLLFALLAYVAWRWYVAQRVKDEPSAEASPPPPPPPATAVVEKMVSCAHCGIHLPQSEAVTGQGALHFCSDEHRLRHEAPRSS